MKEWGNVKVKVENPKCKGAINLSRRKNPQGSKLMYDHWGVANHANLLTRNFAGPERSIGLLLCVGKSWRDILHDGLVCVKIIL